MLRELTKDEIIDGLREALRYYAKGMPTGEDVCGDHCSGFYKSMGEVARQALNRYHEKTRIPVARAGRHMIRVRYEFAGATGGWGVYVSKDDAEAALADCVAHFHGVAVVWMEAVE